MIAYIRLQILIFSTRQYPVQMSASEGCIVYTRNLAIRMFYVMDFFIHTFFKGIVSRDGVSTETIGVQFRPKQYTPSMSYT
jgi:hypothetical protein